MRSSLSAAAPGGLFLSARAPLGILAAAVLLTLATTAGAQPAPSAAEPSLIYTVKPSDKLIRLTRDLLVQPSAWPEVARFNKLRDPNVISPGQKLSVPLRLLKSQPAGARLVSVEGDVQSGGISVATGQAIAEGGKLQTGANSSAVVELGDGTRVKILPNSLAEVVSNRNYAMRDASTSATTTWYSGLVRLAQGSLETLAAKIAQRATPLNVETPTSLVGVRGTQFRVAYEDPASRNSRTEVIEGLVRADNPAQASSAELAAGTGAVINPAQKEVRVVQLLPAPDLTAWPAELFKPRAALTLPTLAGASAFRIQVASDAQFDRIVRDLKVAGQSVELGSLASGNWYARLRGIDGLGLEGLDTVRLVAVKDALPTAWRVLNSTLSLADGKTVLVWTAQQANGQPLAPAPVTAELASDIDFKTVIDRPGAEGQTLVLGALKPGEYFIRLHTRAAGGAVIDSETYRFELPGNWGSTVFDVTYALEKVR